MKNILTTIFILALSFAQAQKVIEKNINYNNQHIELDVKFASEIEVKTWDKATVYFKATIYTKDGKYLDLYDIDIHEGTSSITIESETEDIMKRFWEDRKKGKSKQKKYYYNSEDWYEFNYVLYVPKKAQFKVSSINGDLNSELIDGDFTADLINGNITIKKYSGKLDLRTINGEIDLKVINAKLVAETIHGDIFADEKLDITSTDRYVGQKVYVTTTPAKSNLKLNTINGNMYLRL